MDFAKKLKIRLYTAITFIFTGILFIVTGVIVSNEMPSSLGLMFCVIGIARIRQYFVINKNEESFNKRKVAETDERNVMIWTKARALAFSIYIVISCLGVILLYLFNLSKYGIVLALNLWVLTVIYWICYFITKRKF